MIFNYPFTCAKGTDPGNRPENEDQLVLLPDHGFFAVCDGMGGLSKGKEAAAAVARKIEKLAILVSQSYESSGDQLSPELTGQVVCEVIQRHSADMNQNGRQHGLHYGTTLCVLWLIQARAVFVNIGDSRGYLFRSGTLSQITKDHSIAAILVEQNEITKDEARTHPASSQLLRYMGMDGDAKADIFAEPIQRGDVFLLCSDGLSSMVGDEELARLLRNMQDVEAGVSDLIDAANRNGGKDNISTILVQIA